MKYIRTKDGKIVDLEKFINKEKDTPYYKDFIFEEITKGGVLKWAAVGTEQNSMEEQRGRRCHFSATLNSEIIKQADTIEELCDAFVILYKDGARGILFMPTEINTELAKTECVYGAIWTDKGLIYVAKMNEEGELELL